MQSHAVDIDTLRHSHVFDDGNPLAERNIRWALLLTIVMMIAEISGGWVYNSMALLADGWHMSSHALALGLSVFAYAAARRLAQDARFLLVLGKSKCYVVTPVRYSYWVWRASCSTSLLSG